MVREVTNKIHEAMDEGMIDPRAVADAALTYLSEAQVADMVRINELLPSDPYTDNGYTDRNDYLECMADDFGIPIDTVTALADLLGPDEDFDGLVTSLEEYEDE